MSDYGVWLKVRRDDATYNLCENGDYGFFFANLLSSVETPFSLIDVGANIGLYSLVALTNPCCRGVVAFEPNPETYLYLQENRSFTGRRNFHLVRAAVSSSSGPTYLSWSDGHSGGARLREGLNEIVEGQSCRIEQVIRISSSALSESLSLVKGSGLVIAKVDVEGHELDAVSALLEWAPDRIDLLWIEFTGRTQTVQLEALLNKCGYREEIRIGSDENYDALWTSAKDDALLNAIASGDRTPLRR